MTTNLSPKPVPRVAGVGVSACIEDRPGHQPGGPYAASTGAGASHLAQHLTHGAVPSVEGRKLGHGKGALAVAPGRKAINGQIEAGQLVQRTGEDGGAPILPRT